MSLARVAIALLSACAIPHVDASSAPQPCMTDTGMTCGGLMGSTCEGGSHCSDGRCICDANLCAYGSKCQADCRPDTHGTCGIAHTINQVLGLSNESPLGNGCWTERGPTTCSSEAACLCEEGYCSGTTNWGDCDITGYECGKVTGTCLPRCVQWTGQSCYILGCGGGAECINNECRCPAGHCMVDYTLECVETEHAPEPPANPPPRPKSIVGFASLAAFILFILCCCWNKKKAPQTETSDTTASGREPLLATEPQ